MNILEHLLFLCVQQKYNLEHALKWSDNLKN